MYVESMTKLKPDLDLPPHINVNSIELMPVSQSWAGFAVEREG